MRDFKKAFADVDYITSIWLLKISSATSRLFTVELCSSDVQSEQALTAA